MNYIRPKIKNYENLEEAFDSSDDYFSIDPDVNVSDLNKNRATIVIGEPGLGKTRLLKEYILNNQLPSIFIDLKKVGSSKIDDYIQENYNDFINIDKEENKAKEILKIDRFSKNNFKLDISEKMLFCLDALDEVNSENFSLVVENIKKLIVKYTNSCFFISCRKNYLNKWGSLFSEKYFSYIEILSLDYDDIVEFLTQYKINEKHIDILLNKLNFTNRKLILRNPRYLEIIVDLLKTDEKYQSNNIKRADVFEMFIYKKLDIESKKSKEINSKEIIKKVLEKLALVMEIYQASQISKNELMEFFDDIKSNITVGLLNQISIEKFYNRNLLKDNIDFVEFDNKEFQEYLAAKEILRLGRIDQVIFDLVMVQDLNEINPSWINTLSFIVEFEPSILRKIIEYVFNNANSISIEDFVILLMNADISQLSNEDRGFIFKTIYSFYQNNGQWMHNNISEILSLYYDDSLYYLVEYFYLNRKFNPSTKRVAILNTISLVSHLLENNLLNKEKKNKWINILKLRLNKEDDVEILSKTIFAISKIKDMSIFNNKVRNRIIRTGDDQLVSSLINALEYIDITNKITLECILMGVKIDNIHSRLSLYKIKSNESIKYFLHKLLEDSDLLDSFIEHESTYNNRTDKLVGSINNAVSNDYTLNEVIKKIIIKSCSTSSLWYKSSRSYFLEQIALIVNNNSSDFIFELIKEFKTQGLFRIEYILAVLVTKENTKKFIDLAKKLNQSREMMTIFSIIRNRNNDIYEHGRQYLTNEYSNLENSQQQINNYKIEQDQKIYSEFKNLLGVDGGVYYPDVFNFYLENKQLQNTITGDEKNRLIKLVIIILNGVDPSKQNVSINSINGDSRNYTISSLINIFENCIIIAKEFSLDISPYRQKILDILPFSYDSVRNTIFSLIDNPTSEEIKKLLNSLENRNDDLMIFNPESIIEFFNKNNSSQGIQLLKKFIELDSLSSYNKKYAIETIAKVCDIKEEEFFISIFNKYEKNKDFEILAIAANSVLITKFNNEKSIDWRFNKIKNSYFPFIRKEGVHSMNDEEIELDTKEFAKPLMSLKDLKYKDKFIDLLKNSFFILDKGQEFNEYAFYIWHIIVEYFKNLKELKDYKNLDDLEKVIKDSKNQNGINWFFNQYQQLKLEYMLHIGFKDNISDSIKKYNKIKESTYLKIATPRDLYELIKNVINNDLKKWVEIDGAYKFIREYKIVGAKNNTTEDIIQKTIITQFENGLLKHGLRYDQIHIKRESQLLDGKRTDFLISYGFIGSILIETKLTRNTEITNKKSRENYKKKLIRYIKGTNSYYGIFLVFQIDDEYENSIYIPELEKVYQSENDIQVIGLNCVKEL